VGACASEDGRGRAEQRGTRGRRCAHTSGADDPSAIRLRLATVAFQTSTSCVVPSFFLTIFVVLVMVSMAPMKASLASATPRKR
jgi:hypothetical protein